jgi:aminoglycoside phosphotransferase family enzyme/predicted kinase
MGSSDPNAERLAQHERLVQGLLNDPRAMAAVPSARRLITTAISSLVMAGDEVFKLRKPLVLDFLDFATPERRHDDCLDELRLNRRTAPQLYLDVLPVGGTPDAPRIDRAAAPVLDWALRMRRFDDADRLDRLAERGALDAPLVDALAAEVARFHAALPPSPPTFGAAPEVRRWALGNFEVLEHGPAGASHTARLAALRAWTAGECERLAPLIERRRGSGFVREGHGDLHLANIVRIDGRPVLFDCLEFNPALRHIDIVADLAFLFMDLQRHRLPALAWRLVDGWVQVTGDFEGLALLPFFAVYRALVRAKVALLRVGQHADPQAWHAFERDVALAEQLAAPRRGPLPLVATSGVSGSGKSVLAASLVEALGAVRVRSDVERKRLAGLPVLERPDAAQAALLYGEAMNARTYERLFALADMLLAAGLPVVLDAAFLRRAERDALRALGARHGARTTVLACEAPAAVLRARVAQRQARADDPSDATVAVLERQLATREPIGDDEAACRIDTDAPDGRGAALRCLDVAWAA